MSWLLKYCICIGGQVGRAFTNSLVYAKVVEIQQQMKECLRCYCNAEGAICEPSGDNSSFCVPTPGMRIMHNSYYILLLVSLFFPHDHTIVSPFPTETPLEVMVDVNFIKFMPEENYTVICQINSSARISWTFNGGALPSNTFQLGQHGVKSSLTITFASKDNVGQYACLASTYSGVYNGIDLVHVEINGM